MSRGATWFRKESWNPFGDRIKPEMHVLVKPNWVRHEEHTRFLRGVLATNIGDDVQVHFDFVESISPEKSGKYKLVFSELKG